MVPTTSLIWTIRISLSGLGQGEVYETLIEVTYDKHPATEFEFPGISKHVQYIRNRLIARKMDPDVF
jgi:hypothetical protein